MLRDKGVHQRSACRSVAHVEDVGGHDDSLRLEIRAGLIQARRIAREDRNRTTPFSKDFRHAEANAARSAADDGEGPFRGT
ncbi:hypothetical protein XFLAVUS301_14210 [Xanthobacter flavus]|uniref:Uncharacterized protein n=1 Tax=Xanthobacter flavus TaxID=281 RepID=A0A9W6CL43_XANFL|nr:hypothetical protein XFLAVUS301_14210 [Xanthobacter flavus]